MARPLVPFPIFPPLRYWHGSQSFSSLANRSVSERLRKIDPISQSFSTVELCNEFLGRSAQNCPGPMQFGAVIRKLELMLMWSFHRGISLLSWDADLAVEFLKFWKHPPATWTASTTHLRFIPDTQVPFIDWQINDRWRMFRRPLGADGNPVVPVLSVLCALVKVAADFFDFCQSTGRSSRENPFANWSANEVLRLSRSRARPVLSKHQMDWMFEFVAERIAVRRSYEVRVFLALARDTRYSTLSIVGSGSNPGSLMQFSRGENGGWKYSVTDSLISEDWFALPAEFDFQLETYLAAIDIDPLNTLPPCPLFPYPDKLRGYSFSALTSHLEEFREELALQARRSDDVEIRNGAENFGALSFSMVRRSACALANSEGRRAKTKRTP